MCYASLIRSEEWSYAESLASAVARAKWIESESGQALLETFITPMEVRVLEQGELSVSENALQVVRRRTGRTRSLSEKDEQEEREQRSSSPMGRNGDSPDPPDPDPTTFPPESAFEFLDAVADVRDYERQPELIKQWFQHWEGAGKAEEVLGALDQGFLGPWRGAYNLEVRSTWPLISLPEPGAERMRFNGWSVRKPRMPGGQGGCLQRPTPEGGYVMWPRTIDRAGESLSRDCQTGLSRRCRT